MRERSLIVMGCAVGAVVGAAACGLYGSEDEDTPAPPRSGEDAAPESAPVEASFDAGIDVEPVDADAEAGPCDPRAPFTAITPIGEVNTPDNDDSAHLSTDEKTIYVGRGNSLAVYTRAGLGMPFSGGAGLVVNDGNSAKVRVTDDSLRAYFHARLNGSVGADRVCKRSRLTTTDPWGSTVCYDFEATTGQNEVDPWVSPDETRMYFADDRGGTYVIYATTKVAPSPYFVPYAPVPLDAVAGKNDRSPVVTPDETVIYFSSDRTTAQAGIWVDYRSGGTDGGTADASPVAELAASGFQSYPVYLSADRCRLYFASDRSGGKGMLDVWLASRVP